MPADLVDSELAAFAAGVSVWTLRRAIRESRLCNYGTPRRVRVSLAEVLAVVGDPLQIG